MVTEDNLLVVITRDNGFTSIITEVVVLTVPSVRVEDIKSSQSFLLVVSVLMRDFCSLVSS